MVWWIVGGVVAVSLLGLIGLSALLRRRLAELDRVAALAREQSAHAQGLQAAAEGVKGTLAGIQRRSAAMQRRLARLKRSPRAIRG